MSNVRKKRFEITEHPYQLFISGNNNGECRCLLSRHNLLRRVEYKEEFPDVVEDCELQSRKRKVSNVRMLLFSK